MIKFWTAIANDLAESALFGHVRGAFTGALNHNKGYFEMAQGGTLFLDEIGDMPLLLQAKILRALEDGFLMPVGGNQPKQVDVRIIAATNADLPANLAAGVFRYDLYFRLKGFTITVPPLREHTEDISLLASHFLWKFAVEMGHKKTVLSPTTIKVLENYHFPGNVRELKNIIEHALIRSGGTTIQPHHLHLIDIAPSISAHLSLQNTDIDSDAQEISYINDGSMTSEEDKILKYVRAHGRINNTQCQKLLSSSHHRSSYLLRKLSRKGLLVREGERRWSRYLLP